MRIIPRAEWGHRYGLGWRIRALPAASAWLHHSVTHAPPSTATLAQDAAHMRLLDQIGYDRFKYADDGWTRPAGAGISYTAVVMPSGRIFEGHGIDRASSHTSGYNTNGIGICLAGNYQTSEPTPQALEALAWALVEFWRRDVIKHPRFNGGHRDTGFATSCPGDLLHRHLGSINARAAQVVLGAAPTAPDPSDGFTPAHVERIQTMLNRLSAGLDVDGSLGPATRAAVTGYQAARGLTPDGLPGPLTTAALEEDMATLESIAATQARILAAIGPDDLGNRSLADWTRQAVNAATWQGPARTVDRMTPVVAAAGDIDADALAAAISAQITPVLADAVATAGTGATAEQVADEIARRLATGTTQED